MTQKKVRTMRKPPLRMLLDQIFNRNLAIDSQYFYSVMGALYNEGRIDFSVLGVDGQEIEAAELSTMAAGFSREAPKPYRVQDGAAIIPVHGSLSHRFGYLQPTSGMTGYDGLRYNIEMAESDPDVNGIIYDINSPGGSVDGLFDLTDWAKAYVTKPTRAIVDPQATSAAQLFSAIADVVTLSRTDRMGSIGAITAHMDVSKMLEGRGQKITLITAGARKAEGNAYEALPEAVFNAKQSELEQLRQMFAQSLVNNRGADFNALMATEAAVINATQAVELKLADKIMSPADSLAEFIDQINQTSGVAVMPQTNNQAAAPESQGPQLNEAEIRAEATQAERARIKDIIMSAESEGRIDMAHHIAFSTDMDATAATAMLNMAPKASATLEETTPQAHTDFATVMQSYDPNVPATTDGVEAEAQSEPKSKNPLIAAHQSMHA